MKGSQFIFDSVQMMYYKCRKVNFRRGGSYIDSIKKKNTAITLKSKGDKCFQYAVTVALNMAELNRIPKMFQMLNRL